MKQTRIMKGAPLAVRFYGISRAPNFSIKIIPEHLYHPVTWVWSSRLFMIITLTGTD